MLQPHLCDYSDAYTVFKRTNTIPRGNNSGAEGNISEYYGSLKEKNINE